MTWHITRRQFARLVGLAGLGSIVDRKTSAASEARPVIGATRWDAWYDPDGKIGKAVEESLGPKEFHDRMPFFGRVVDDDHVVIDGNHQEIMDKEIRYAAGIGLNYWAYCWYPPDSPMQKAWQLHQSSQIKSKMNWCMLWVISNLGGEAKFRDKIPSYVSWLGQANYQTALGSRPLLYFYVDQIKSLATGWRNDWAVFKAAFDSLRDACRVASIGDPYLVVMHPSPARAAEISRQIGADAISNYLAPVPHEKVAPYAKLIASARAYWDTMAGTGEPVVPIAMTGWDTRPRKAHPPFWEQHATASADMDDYVQAPGPGEIGAAIQAARVYVETHPQVCPSRLVLVYSWDECDEGGSALVPNYTPSGPDERLLSELGNQLKR